MQCEKLIESNDILSNPVELRRRLWREGYLFFRGLLPREEVLDLRRHILELCDDAGWISKGADLMEGLTDHEPVLEGEPAHLPVYAEVQKLEAFHRLKLHPNMQQVMRDYYDEEVFALPNTIARIAFPRDNERATQPHQDWLYIQGSTDTISCWVPVGDVPEEIGGLMILPRSHKSGFLVPHPAPGPGGNAVDLNPSWRWAGTDYRAGDVLCFPSLTVHAARPNLTSDRIRLSMDFRYVGLSHSVAESNLLPHFNWCGSPFTWDDLDRDWKDQSLRRYWEHVPELKTCKHERRVYSNG